MTNTDRSDAPKRKNGMPPLAWIIVGLLVLIAAIAFFTMDGVRQTAPVDLPRDASVVDSAAVPATAPAAAPTRP